MAKDNEEVPKCRSCKKPLIGKNAIDVGYCIPLQSMVEDSLKRGMN